MVLSKKKQTPTQKRALAKKRAETRKRVQKRRDALKKMGLRPIQIWVPDTRKKGFAAECRRQSLLLKNDKAHEDSIMKWVEASSDDVLKDWKP